MSSKLKTAAFLTLASGILCLTSCLGERAALTNVHALSKEWSHALADLGVVPIYPPREDVKVGDIFISSCDPLNPELDGCRVDTEAVVKTRLGIKKAAPAANSDPMPELSARWFTIPVGEALDKDYLARMTPAATSPTAMAGEVGATAQQPFLGDTQNPPVFRPVSATAASSAPRPDIFSNGVIDRLRIVGFPEFTAGVSTSGNLSAIVPAEALNVAFAASANKNQSVVIKVPAAESYGLPVDTLLDMVFTCGAEGCQLKDKFLPRLSLAPFNADHQTHLRIITEVYYARAIDVEIGSAFSGGASGKVGTPLGLPSGQAPGPPTTNPTLLTQLNGQLDTATGGAAGVAGPGKTPGAAVSFVAASDRGVTLRRVWERPIAIGVRGIFVTIDNKGKVVSASRPFAPGDTPFKAIVSK